MSQAISDELFTISHSAAGRVRPGATVKEQLNTAWVNLGKPPMWRLRSAWWRDGSADWSAKAVQDFQQRYLAWRDRQAKQASANAAAELLLRQQSDLASLEAAQREYVAALAKIEMRLTALRDRGDP